MRACAEGLLGDLIRSARCGDSDITNELPIHAVIQSIAASRGYHHHHEYPIFKRHILGDWHRIDFVFHREIYTEIAKPRGTKQYSLRHDVVALEVKLYGTETLNNTDPFSEVGATKSDIRACRDVTADMKKLVVFCTKMSNVAKRLGIDANVNAFFLAINLDAHRGISWDPVKARLSAAKVEYVDRFEYTSQSVSKSTTLYQIQP
jgi:hypothetical protein